jgi:hypothetical protein
MRGYATGEKFRLKILRSVELQPHRRTSLERKRRRAKSPWIVHSGGNTLVT